MLEAVEFCFEVVVVEPEVGVLEPERVVLRLQLLRVSLQRVVVGPRDGGVVAGEEEEREGQVFEEPFHIKN